MMIRGLWQRLQRASVSFGVDIGSGSTPVAVGLTAERCGRVAVSSTPQPLSQARLTDAETGLVRPGAECSSAFPGCDSEETRFCGACFSGELVSAPCSLRPSTHNTSSGQGVLQLEGVFQGQAVLLLPPQPVCDEKTEAWRR